MTNITRSLSYLPLDVSCLSRTPDPIEQIWALSHDRSSLVRCHNLSSARAYASGRLPNKVAEKPVSTVSVTAWVSPTGQYYVQHGNQRLDVANASSARHYVKNGVPVATLLEAWQENWNRLTNRNS